MLRALSHRGPDGSGIAIRDTAILGNARLAITDLREDAALPWSRRNDPSGACLAYNGALLNGADLRARLIGHEFRSSSDAEVVFAWLSKYGAAGVSDLVGHFSLAFFDPHGRSFLARDLYGPRPLFYVIHRGALYFGSELKALVQVPGISVQPNISGLADFLTLAYIPGEQTAFENIWELEAGHILYIDELTPWRFADHHFDEVTDLSFDEAVGQVRDAMVRSVADAVDVDAPIGSTLSGGIDTSSIVCMAARHIPKLKTYSIRMGEKSFDESVYQRMVAKHVGAQHREITVGPEDVLKRWSETVQALDEPLGDGAAIPSYILADIASQEVKVLLSGEGGDEVFNAYETHGAALFRSGYRRWVPGAIRTVVSRLVHQLPVRHHKLSFDFVARRIVDGCEMDVCAAHVHWRHCLPPNYREGIFPGFVPERPERWFEKTFDRVRAHSDIDRISAVDLEHFLVGDLMVKNDRTFMAHGIEGRFPWLDQRLGRLMRTMPHRWRIRSVLERRFLEKKAIEPFVPKQILRRTNMGLEMPHSGWFKGPWRPWLESMLHRDRVRQLSWLNPVMVEEIMGLHLANKQDYGRLLWCLCNLVEWHEQYIQG
ncbi:MAG: asparagine synthase (glutamine-hydrolyzing) [Deltaproteobacteria bacterium]|jgi:asparagine synthase (glutamine-hydrolysing)|nr:asparagine synthase (glutamine-hydrolyzing) [Deltaproteobacteria bacterium]MBT6435469.1 asparagine synthase (glutamine-hydrolyzing) [Deltaproteobacteria bacterium]MBT6492446.1 asparagine synthase (glutamine-hydrolyzing) [Deltaproteobacteria bacterium]